MSFMKRLNDLVSGVLTAAAAISLVVLCMLVLYGVVLRYVFNNAPDFVEPIALLLVIVIAFFGAALKVRDGGHIGLDSLVTSLPPKAQLVLVAFQHLCLMVFAVAVFIGCQDMASTTLSDRIPIIDLPEATRYWIPMLASVCIALFSLEHLLNMFSHKRT
jgi:TRAP-type C4-dicarboxylate transport system permease small subunit